MYPQVHFVRAEKPGALAGSTLYYCDIALQYFQLLCSVLQVLVLMFSSCTHECTEWPPLLLTVCVLVHEECSVLHREKDEYSSYGEFTSAGWQEFSDVCDTQAHSTL